MRQIAFETVDVFAESRFGGNPLAVIADARELSTAEMQSIAREFNYSESTFVVPPSDPANTARVRIFTPASEIPFAGHPNVGTAFVLGQIGAVFGKPAGDVMRFEEDAGLVAVELTRAQGRVSGASIRAPRQLERGEHLAPEVVAACASLSSSDIVWERHSPAFASVGLPFIVAEVQSVGSLARAKPDTAAFVRAREEYGGDSERFSLFLYARVAGDRVRARMFAPLSKVPEDPATGSASAALGGLLASLGGDGDLRLTIEQGVEMGRPSLIHVLVETRDGRQSISVAGGCVPVLRGTITI